MSIKIKLYLAFGFLFIVIVLLGGMGGYYLRQLATDSKAIIKDNYETLIYIQHMQEAVSELKTLHTKEFFNSPLQVDTSDYIGVLAKFESNLIKEEQNVTEIGEAELASSLRNTYEKYLGLLRRRKIENNSSANFYFNHLLPITQLLEKEVRAIMDINMQAIVRKNQMAQQTANRVLTYMALIGTGSILIAFAFFAAFPSYVANPLGELTTSIQEIANRNYDKRIEVKSSDEYGSLANAFNSMASRLEEYENSNLSKLLFEKKRIETIINHMQDAIIGLDENKYVLFANLEALSILQISQGELVGKYAPDIASIHDLFRELIQELMIGFDSWEKKEFKPLKLYAHGKEAYYSKEILDVSMSKTTHGKVRLIGHVIILKNITSFKELDAAKTNFIATISHELKTPISSIKMSTRLLEDNRVGSLNEEQKKLIGHIKDDSHRLLKITAELLDLAQVETGNIQLQIREANPLDIIEYACKAVDFLAEQKHIVIERQIEKGLPQLQADVEKTVWVMVNLLSNAIRYSTVNSKIIVKAIVQNDLIEFSVQDFGKGINSQYSKRVFDKFFQVPEGDESQKGTGLGLAISKEFIEAQAGSIWVESTPAKGSSFKFVLPVIKRVEIEV